MGDIFVANSEPMRNRTKTRPGYTLVELLIVIGIIGALMALLMPALASVRESSRRTECSNNLHQYGIALNSYHVSNRSYPIGNVPNKWWTFQSRLLPYIGGKDIYAMCDYNYPGDCFQQANSVPKELDPGNRVLPYDVCPNDPNAGKIWFSFSGFGRHGCTNYLGMMGTSSTAQDGIFFSNIKTKIADRDLKDGAGKTIIMGERGTPDDLYWGWTYCGYGADGTGDGDNLCSTRLGLSSGNSTDYHTRHFWSYHIDSAFFLFADGAVRSLQYNIDFATFQAMSTRATGEVFQPNW